jgi:hypothetical protein
VPQLRAKPFACPRRSAAKMVLLPWAGTANPRLRSIFNSSYEAAARNPYCVTLKTPYKHTLWRAQNRIYPANALKFEMLWIVFPLHFRFSAALLQIGLMSPPNSKQVQPKAV